MVLLIDPPMAQVRNTAGVAFLRGYLTERNIKNAAVNFNGPEYSSITAEYRKQLHDVLDSDYDHIAGELDDDYYLSSLVYKRGQEYTWDTAIIIAKKCKKLKKWLTEYGPPTNIGISVTFHSQFLFSLVLSILIREIYGDSIKVIIGGNSVTGFRGEIFSFLRRYPVINYVVVGDGESALYSIVTGEDRKSTPNLAYIKKGRCDISKIQNYHQNINYLPDPIYEPGEKIFLRATNRCYWNKCSYCTYHQNLSQNLDTCRVEKIINYLRSIDNNCFCAFTDASLPPSFLNDFSDAILEDDTIGSLYGCFLRSDKNVTFGLLEKANRAGFFEFWFGPETLSDRLLKLLNKGHTREDALRLIRDCNKLNIKMALHFIINLPTQTKDELQREFSDIAYILSSYQSISSVMISTLQVRPGSKIIARPQDYNIKVIRSNKGFLPRFFPFEQLSQGSLSAQELSACLRDFIAQKPMGYEKIKFYID